MEVDRPAWKKVGRSEGGANNCVEIKRQFEAVRDSKQPAAVLLVNVEPLIVAAKLGRLDH